MFMRCLSLLDPRIGIVDATVEIRQLLMERHHIAPGQKPDFEVQSSNEISNFLGQLTGIMTALLASIAGISLLVEVWAS